MIAWALVSSLLVVCVCSACDVMKFTCSTPDGKYGTCINGTCTVIQAEVRKDLRFKIVVRYPETTLKMHNGRELYMRGNALGFSWRSGIQLIKTAVDTWQATIKYKSSRKGFTCQSCQDQTYLSGTDFEYRIYIDDKIDMIGGNFQLKLPISKASSYFDAVPVYHIYPWFFSKTGSVDTVPIASTQIGGIRDILIYTPPSFEENTYKSYPTMLVFDLNEELYNTSVELINSPIVEEATVGEFILVGFGDYHPQTERTDVLTQVSGPSFTCTNGTFLDRCGNCLPTEFDNYTVYLSFMHKCGKDIEMGGKGNDTLDFLVKTVLPKVNRLKNNRMLVDQPNLGVMGYSLGGLMACHAAWTRPKIFGYGACQSPSFWWPKLDDDNDAFFFNNVTLKDQGLRTNRPFQRIYLDAGGLETQAPFTLTQAMVSAAEDMVATGFFEWDKNLWADVYPGDKHSGVIWVSRMWNALRIFFPTRPAPAQTDSIYLQSKCSPKTNGGQSIETSLINSLIFLFMSCSSQLLR